MRLLIAMAWNISALYQGFAGTNFGLWASLIISTHYLISHIEAEK